MQIEIVAEREARGRWEFDAQVIDAEGSLHSHRILLSWADYNLWSPDGADEPSRVAEAVLGFLLNRSTPGEIGSKFDASMARRRFDDADQEIPKLIAR